MTKKGSKNKAKQSSQNKRTTQKLIQPINLKKKKKNDEEIEMKM